MSSAGAELMALLALMRRLRDPERGCPWDRVQTFASIARYSIEEAYELADAIGRGQTTRLRDELGDLLFQVVFHARIAEEQQLFDFAAVARGIHDKLVRRHPHVFAAATGAGVDLGVGRGTAGSAGAGADELRASWEAHKARERSAAGEPGVLADVPLALPALARASKLGQRAARVGFDWQQARQVRAKVEEELQEIDAALAEGQPARIAEEIGDLLFAVANWARHLQVEPESALRSATRKFEQRFEHMETLACARGLILEQLSAAQWDELWEAAKAAAPQEPPASASVPAVAALESAHAPGPQSRD